jgi:hypothetical protein
MPVRALGQRHTGIGDEHSREWRDARLSSP